MEFFKTGQSEKIVFFKVRERYVSPFPFSIFQGVLHKTTE